MIKSISYWSVAGGLEGTRPVNEALADAKQAGFAGMELCIGLEGVLTPGTSQAECEGLRSEIDKSGLVVETLASGMTWGLNPTSERPEVRRQALEATTAALHRAAWLGCDSLLFVPGVVTSPIVPAEHVRYDRAVERATETVKRLLEVAEEVNVDLCIENVWNGLFYSPLEFKHFVESFETPRIGVYFDVGNVLGYHQHPPHWIVLLGTHIKRVHVKDFRHHFDWDGSYSFCMLGEGDVPWPETMAALRAIGYDRTLVAEMLPHRPGILETTCQAMDRILAA
ncbi:MAG: sugar phosphate isomerase/epimerase [Pirellulales bacterium]|nr:sugar phosphate isomerase/epimerase [Pirellulales bacterium]